MIVGEGLLAGRHWAMRTADVNKPEGKGYVTAYSEWLKRYKVDDIDKSDRAKLLELMEERLAIEEWRATLTDDERRNLNHPTIVWRRWKAVTRIKTRTVSTREMQRARATIAQLQGRVEELEQELAAARNRIAELEQ